MNSALFSFDLRSIEIVEARVSRGRVTVVLRSTSSCAKCPLCGLNATRVHSFYRRQLADLPWLGTPVSVKWRSRRFFCDNARCTRKIFTERRPEIAATYARRTARLEQELRELALVCGGEPGSRVAAKIGMPASGDTLLRLLHKLPLAPLASPRVLGVDDWAIRRGHRYGTILCDLERHCVVDLLPDRTAESFADWLRNHSEVEIVSRDRGEIYIRGATIGAPNAIQVADRWHLMKNLSDAMKAILDRHHLDIRSAGKIATAQLPRDMQTPDSKRNKRSQSGRQLVEQHRQSRMDRYDRVREMHERGLSLREIARQTGLNFKTVRRFAQSDRFPERQQRQRRRCVHEIDSYDDFLRRRWKEGCRDAKRLTKELSSRGFKGSYYMVVRYVRAWRDRRQVDGNQQLAGSLAIPKLTSRRVAWILKKSTEDQSEFEKAFVKAIREQCPSLATAHELAQEFRLMMRSQDASKLQSWLAKVETTDLKSFGEGLALQEASIRAAFELPWSNGQTEGQVNRLKNLKRQMYGRASVELLKTRMLGGQSVREAAPRNNARSS